MAIVLTGVKYVAFCLFPFLSTLNGLEIFLFEYGSGQTETVSKRLLANQEMIVFRGQVNYTDDPEAQFVYFQTLKKSDNGYNYLCHIDLKDKCMKTEYFSAKCACTTITDHIVEINVTVRASLALNGALLRCTVIRSYDNKQFLSEEKLFPEIYDSQEPVTIDVSLLNMCIHMFVFFAFFYTLKRFLGNITNKKAMNSTSIQARNEEELINNLCQKDRNDQNLVLTKIQSRVGQENNGSPDSQENNDTDDSQETNDTDGSQENICNDDNQENNGSDDGPENLGTHDGQKIIGTDDCKEHVATDDGQADDGSDDGQIKKVTAQSQKDNRIFQDTNVTFETQMVKGGEADLVENYKRCKKNPDHKHFVPVLEFNANHLPEGYNDNDLFEFIKSIVPLTVRVCVENISSQRPQFWPNSHLPYPFYNMREQRVKRFGTGMVWSVDKWTKKYIEEHNMGTCKCHKCQQSDSPSKEWGQIWMRTASQVVFDDDEAKQTTCRLFFDGEDSPLRALDGWKVKAVNILEDSSELEYVTCDIDLLSKLIKMLKHWKNKLHNVNKKYKHSEDNSLILIVSHPHGCPKHITIGNLLDRHVIGGNKTKYLYTTCTCLGSSGAYVHSLRYSKAYYDFHVHSGVNSLGKNFSGTGLSLD